MTILSQISGPDDLKGRSFADLTQLAAEIRSGTDQHGHTDRGPPGRQSGHGRAQRRAAHRLRFAEGSDRLGRRPSGLYPQAANRPL